MFSSGNRCEVQFNVGFLKKKNCSLKTACFASLSCPRCWNVSTQQSAVGGIGLLSIYWACVMKLKGSKFISTDLLSFLYQRYDNLWEKASLIRKKDWDTVLGLTLTRGLLFRKNHSQRNYCILVQSEMTAERWMKAQHYPVPPPRIYILLLLFYSLF